MPSGGVNHTGACQRCHRRKVRCDKAQPSCAPCARAETPCQYAPSDVQRRQQNNERLERRIRELEAENRNLSGRLSDVSRNSIDRSTTYATPTSAGPLPQADDVQHSPEQGEVANQVIHLSLSAGGGRNFVGSTSGLFLANLLQSHTQPIPTLLQTAGPQLDSRPDHNGRVGTSSPPAVSSLPPRRLAKEILHAYHCHDHLIYPCLFPTSMN